MCSESQLIAIMSKFQSFISVVGVVHQAADVAKLSLYIRNVYPVLCDYFTDFEIVLVNNIPQTNLQSILSDLPPAIKQQVFLLQLASRTDKNHAILAGLDRSNGDYTIIFDPAFAEEPQVIVQLYEKSLEQFDIVYLRANNRDSGILYSSLYAIFYFILRRFSDFDIDDKAHTTRIISRRALNSLLKLRENLHHLKAVFSIVGYRTIGIDTATPLPHDESIGRQFRNSLAVIASYTTFLRSVMLWLFLLSFLFLVAVVINALKVKFTQTDIFGNTAVADAGWTFLVVLISVFFAAMTLNLYIISIYLSNIYTEIKQRPPYIIESVRRF
ncbi:MAG: glycosyltransferase [Saprospiraceae bacterium]